MVVYVNDHIHVNSDDVKCFVCGFEFGKEEKHPHLQLYLKLSSTNNRNNYMSKFRNVFGFKFTDNGTGWWFQFANGSETENLTYCSKTGINKNKFR